VRLLAVALVLVASTAISVVVLRELVPVRRLPLLRLAYAPLAVITVGLGGTAGLVALVAVLLGIAVTATVAHRRHGAMAWTGGAILAEPTIARFHDPQLHVNGVRRPRPRRDPRVRRIDGIGPALVADLAGHGVQHIEVTGGYDTFGAIELWLGTATDEQRDRLGSRDPLLSEVRAVLSASGIDDDVVTRVRTRTQSQETVDRDHDGNWFAAMR
jgi:hypothetical protein